PLRNHSATWPLHKDEACYIKAGKTKQSFHCFNANFLFSIAHNRISKESHLEVKMIEQIIDFEVAREAMVECQVLPG
ncbi:MAG TPA: hypothetical protein DCP14_08325, partial [Rhodobiaceae bacterium]|nr:hypothetical protein [Rhodobiaceae bacterium]